jgi:hypothetical protein
MTRLRWLLPSVALGALMFATTAPAQTQRGQDSSSTTANRDDANVRDSMTVPDGTELVVRTNEAIDSTNATEGRTFSGTIEQDVTGASGQVLIPKGSNTDLVIRKVSSGGTTGSPQVALDIQAINIGGHRYVVSTSDIQQGNNSGIGKNRRTGEYVGGGAAVGTLLGAIAGGGKGALIGAVAGAAAGGTAQVLTKGKEVKVPAETTLKFRLDRPLTLRATGS